MPKAVIPSFKTGELAVYPAHGVGLITGVESRDVSGENRCYYIIKVLDTDAIIMVPVDNAETVGLRKVVTRSMVPKVYQI